GARRPRWVRAAAGAPALGRRAVAPRARPRPCARSRRAVSRRADREPRSRRHQGHRGHHPRDRGERYQGGHVDPRPGRGEAAGGRDRPAAPRPHHRARAGRRLPRRAAPRWGARVARARTASGNEKGGPSVLRRVFLLMFAVLLLAAPAAAQDKFIVVASTTSTQDSGLFGYLLPLFKMKTGIDVRVVAQGTGQALDTGRRG